MNRGGLMRRKKVKEKKSINGQGNGEGMLESLLLSREFTKCPSMNDYSLLVTSRIK